MIILTAGHTGAHAGAQCIATQFDEGAETIWLRDRIAEILTNKYGLVVLMDNDTASLQTLTREITEYRLQSTDDTLLPTPYSLLIDIHFNAHTNPNARGTETIVSDNATDLELRMASR